MSMEETEERDIDCDSGDKSLTDNAVMARV